MNAAHPSGDAPPWLSVIIPAHNAATTIECTLDCLARQSDPDWEAIVIDDSSSDDTVAIVARRAEADQRIRLISVRAGGVSAARNAGLPHATGERLLFLDSDDWIADSYIETMRGALDGSGAGVAAYCAYQRVNPAGEHLPPQFDSRVAQAPIEYFVRQCGTAIHCVVLDRALVVELGGFDTTLRTSEDWYLWYCVARRGVHFVGVNQPMAFYRMKEGSLTADSAQMIRDGLSVLARTFAEPEPADTFAMGAYPVRVTLLYVWFATVEIGRGKRGAHLLLPLQAPRMLEHMTLLVELVVAALSVGAGCDSVLLAARFHTFAEPLAELLAQLERTCNEPGLARALTYDLERRLLHLSGLHTPTVLGGLMMGARVDLRRPVELNPPDSVDLMYLLLCDGQKVLGSVDIPVVEGWRARLDREELSFEGLIGPRAYLRGTTPQRRSRFVANFLGYGTRRAARHATKVWRREARSTPLHSELRVAAQLALRKTGGRLPASGRVAELLPPRAARSEQVPVLMYHSVSESGADALARYRTPPAAFEAQMQWLRRHGYHCLSSRALGEHLASDTPFVGKPVVITFDDGYADFRHSAWPILRRCGLQAEVFIVTDLVGQTSSWDAHYGTPAPLMGWDDIRALAREGVGFGSHLASHRRADTLSSAELAHELARSRSTLEAQLGRPVTSIAAPFGFIDSRYLNLGHKAGYEIGYSVNSGFVQLGATPLALRRLEMHADLSLEAFGKMLEGADADPVRPIQLGAEKRGTAVAASPRV